MGMFGKKTDNNACSSNSSSPQSADRTSWSPGKGRWLPLLASENNFTTTPSKNNCWGRQRSRRPKPPAWTHRRCVLRCGMETWHVCQQHAQCRASFPSVTLDKRPIKGPLRWMVLGTGCCVVWSCSPPIQSRFSLGR